jgi:RimJ/RimL family protein N-acetyltransferase
MRDSLYVALADGDLSLELLAERHRDALRAACALDLDIWEMYGVSYGPGHFDASFDALIGHESRMPHAVVLNGDVVGMSAYLRPDWAGQCIEIGNSYLVPAVRGTGFNRRVKRLQLDHAFAVGIRRVEFRIDERNKRSQAAVAKLGCLKEGTLRAERITWTGHVRDTALWAILADEWRANDAQHRD